MNNKEYVDQLIAAKGPHAALVELISKMRADEATTLLQSAAQQIPTNVTWNILRDSIARERVNHEEKING